MALIEDLTPLYDIAAKIMDAYRGKLAARSYSANGMRNFSWNFEYNGDIFRLYMTVPYYWKWVEDGNPGRGPGKRPPIAAIAKWIDVKRISIPGIKKESLPYVIANSIAKKGQRPIPGTKDLQQTLVQNQSTIEELCSEITRLANQSLIVPDIHSAFHGMKNIREK